LACETHVSGHHKCCIHRQNGAELRQYRPIDAGKCRFI
jgi:hypothetical protein